MKTAKKIVAVSLVVVVAAWFVFGASMLTYGAYYHSHYNNGHDCAKQGCCYEP